MTYRFYMVSGVLLYRGLHALEGSSSWRFRAQGRTHELRRRCWYIGMSSASCLRVMQREIAPTPPRNQNQASCAVSCLSTLGTRSLHSLFKSSRIFQIKGLIEFSAHRATLTHCSLKCTVFQTPNFDYAASRECGAVSKV